MEVPFRTHFVPNPFPALPFKDLQQCPPRNNPLFSLTSKTT
jgi:hypothetical protein